MRRYSEAVKADVRKRMSPPHCQSVVWISERLDNRRQILKRKVYVLSDAFVGCAGKIGMTNEPLKQKKAFRQHC